MTTHSGVEGVYRLPASLSDDLAKLERMVEDYKADRVSPAQFRAYRVPLGVYEQRQAGSFMLRVRLAAGGVLPHQMRALATVAAKYGSDLLHVTTRQDIQVHEVPLEALHPALVELQAAGLSTKGGGGNTVRNVTACSDAGVCPKEAFDVSPYAVGVTEFLLPDPANYQLPRKYKIAFSGCGQDCAGATVNDLGLIARRRDGETGFAVYVAGGMGAKSRVADLFEEFAPVAEVHLIAEAVKRVFDKHGNRKNRHKARLRFLVEKMGLEQFRDLYRAELAELKQDPPPPPEIRDLPRRPAEAPQTPGTPAEGFDAWCDRNTTAQKQEGYFLVHIPLILGDVSTDTLAQLADVVEAHGEGMARTTQWQNLVLRWVCKDELAAVHRKLLDLGLAETPAPVVRNVIACAGASTCKLGICLARGLARAVIHELGGDGLDLGGLGDLRIHTSGCPNSCGRHPVGDIGFFGAARRVAGKLAPHYVAQLGGRVGEGRSRLAEGKLTIPARNVPAFTSDFLKAFQASRQYADFHAFIDADGRRIAAEIAEKYKTIPSFGEDKNYYFDWGAEELFSLAGRGPGECGAGVFELIEVDLASAREAVDAGALFAATALAARALLVTQGLEAANDEEALALFERHFVDANLLADSFRSVTAAARECSARDDPAGAFDADPGQVAALVKAVQDLYDNMDSSLRFRPTDSPEKGPSTGECPPGCVCAAAPEAKDGEAVPADREADFRGVVCPLNYVKTKLLLEQMDSGQVLAVLLDDEGARNVPQSAEQDGHQAISVTREEDHWRVILRKS